MFVDCCPKLAQICKYLMNYAARKISTLQVC